MDVAGVTCDEGESTMSDITIVGGTPEYERRIRTALRVYPPWLIRAARLSGVIIDTSPEMASMLASYRHEDRSLHVYPNLASMMLTKAIGHELWHGADDNYLHPHFFSSKDVWTQIHRDQAYFDIPKYREQPLEYFADIGVKISIYGSERLKIRASREVLFFEQVVIPKLLESFGGT